jgi:hypothetical protein
MPILASTRRSRAGLQSYACPYCGRYNLDLQVLLNYPCALGFMVPEALVNVCTGCGGHVVTEAEWEAWKEEIACLA